jgi:hypothetical protein
MKLIINSMSKDGNLEVMVSKEEAVRINQAIMADSKFINIRGQFINTRYIIGIFDGDEPVKGRKLLNEGKPDLEKISSGLEKIKKNLEKKGILK